MMSLLDETPLIQPVVVLETLIKGALPIDLVQRNLLLDHLLQL